jgi:predicted GNAT family acetyltransferase
VTEPSDVTVRDDPPSNSYELLVGGDRVARLHYLPTRGALVLVHTEVAPELEGKGLGGRLVAGALEDMRARGLRLVPVCPFVTSYLERHPEYAELVAREPAAPS